MNSILSDLYHGELRPNEHPDSFRHTHDKILKAIGAEHIRFHDLRHPYVKHTTNNNLLQMQSLSIQSA